MEAAGNNPQEPRRKMPRPIWVYPLTTLFLWSVGLILFFKFFDTLKVIGLGLLASASVTAALRPVASRIPGPRSLSAVLTGLLFVLVVGGVIFLVSWLLVAPVRAQLEQWGQLKVSLDGVLTHWSRSFGVSQPPTVDALGNQLTRLITGENVANLVTGTANFAATLALVVAFVFIGSIYLLASPPNRYSRPLLRLLPPWRRPAMEGVLRDLEPQLRWWLIGSAVGMVSIGVASYLGYTIVGLHWALPLAMFAGLTEFVPTVGPAATLLVALLLAATQGAAQVIGVLIVYLVVQGLESYVLIPLVMKSAVDIPPVVALFTLILWGKLLGLAGLLLAIPIDLFIWNVLDHFVIQRRQAVTPNHPP